MTMRYLVIILLQFYLVPVFAAEAEPGASLGAKISETPLWFKESFLDFEEDVAEAAAVGNQSTVKQWVAELDIAYTPSVVFFDSSGAEVMRIGAFLKAFHFQSVYDYVMQKAYLQEPSFQRFILKRAEKIREAGFDTNIWDYQSSH